MAALSNDNFLKDIENYYYLNANLSVQKSVNANCSTQNFLAERKF